MDGGGTNSPNLPMEKPVYHFLIREDKAVLTRLPIFGKPPTLSPL